MGEYKANQIIVIQDMFKKQPQDEAAFIGTLLPEELEAYTKAMPISWFAIEVSASITTKAMPFLYPGELDKAYFKFGEHLARSDLSGMYRIMVRISSVPFLLDQTAKLWKLYHRQGHMRMQKKERSAELLIEDYPDFPVANHKVMMGYIYGAVALTGAKEVKVEGNVLGVSTIEYKISWK
ncbi:hypothetical protein K8S19_10805 [bacterium]|nr:hypothetical protein [bacterium]